jgi:transposase-like protein
MANYRADNLELSKRVEIVLEMWKPIPEREWGWVSEIAREHKVTRQVLYKWSNQAREAIEARLMPRQPGPKAKGKEIVVDTDYIRLVTTVMATQKGSLRDIQQGLELMFGVRRSVGYIQDILQRVGEAAAAYNAQAEIPQAVKGEADEIFQGRQPCLTVVDGASFLVLHLGPSESRDATAWGIVFLELQARGVEFRDLVSDGAGGIQAGMREAELEIPWYLDLFHPLKDALALRQKLENAGYRAIKEAERTRRAVQEAQNPQPRPGRRLAVKVPLAQAENQEEEAIMIYDAFVWLCQEMRAVLEPITSGSLVDTQHARDTLETVAELMSWLEHRDIAAFARKLLDNLDALLAPLIWLEETLAPWRAALDPETEQLILWAWRHRHTLELDAGEGFPPEWHSVVRAFWDALALFHRASSLAESLHSWLRPYLVIHRGMPEWLFPLLQLFWNHHTFQRGKRAGSSPVQLAGIDNALSLSEALHQVLDAAFSAFETPAFPSQTLPSQMAA